MEAFLWSSFSGVIVNWLVLEAAESVKQSQLERLAEGAIESGAKRAVEGATDAAGKAVLAVWEKVQWRSAEHSYVSRLSSSIATTRILHNPRPIQVSDVFTELLFKDQRGRMSESVRQTATVAVESGKSFYILGHPGAGKTTLLKYIAIRCCNGTIPKVPIFVPLRDLANSKHDLFQYMADEFEGCGLPNTNTFLRALLRNRKALVLLDGLDEIPDYETRSRLIYQIRELLRKYPESQVLLTCRIAASEYTFETLEYAELAPFTVGQQRVFISQWFANDKVSQIALLESWKSPRAASLHDLAKTPLLLTMICLAYEEFQDLPEKKVSLYRDAFDVLLRRWDSTRQVRRMQFYAGLTPNRRGELIQELACEVQESDQVVFSASDVSSSLVRWFSNLPDPINFPIEDTEALLRGIESQHGLIAERTDHKFTFAHLSFQEFLTAQSVQFGHSRRPLRTIVARHATNPRWREVFIFLAELLPDATTLLTHLRDAVAHATNNSSIVLSVLGEVHGLAGRLESIQDAPSTWPQDLNAIVEAADKEPAGIILRDLIGRLRSLRWSYQYHGLALRCALLLQFLPRVARDETFLRYIQGLSLLVDCASVAVCSNRVEIIASILQPRQK